MNWKILAIVLMVLFLIQSFYLGWIHYLGVESLKAEVECENLCLNNRDCYAMDFDLYTQVCYLYDYNGEILNSYFKP